MSAYSGKFDLCDWINEDFDKILNYEFYLGNNIVPLRIENEHDLVPYYPYLVCVGGYNKIDNCGTIKMANESYIDELEREILEWYQNDVIKYLKRCKRMKVEPNFGEFIVFDKYNKSAKQEIFNRVLNKNNSLSDIHLEMQDYYRMNLYKEMLRVGWGKNKAKLWCFGWRKNYPKECE